MPPCGVSFNTPSPTLAQNASSSPSFITPEDLKDFSAKRNPLNPALCDSATYISAFKATGWETQLHSAGEHRELLYDHQLKFKIISPT